MRNTIFILLVILSCLLQPHTIFASEQPTHANTVYRLSKNLRCLTCSGQSVWESDAPFALELRSTITRLLEKGQSESSIIDFLHERYGSKLFFTPPTSNKLWLCLQVLPCFLFICAFVWFKAPGVHLLSLISTTRTKT